MIRHLALEYVGAFHNRNRLNEVIKMDLALVACTDESVDLEETHMRYLPLMFVKVKLDAISQQIPNRNCSVLHPTSHQRLVVTDRHTSDCIQIRQLFEFGEGYLSPFVLFILVVELLV